MTDSQETCPVCFEGIKTYGFCVTNCSHIFCMNCMVKCIKNGHDGCPICRQELCSTPVDSVLTERERSEQFSAGWENGFEVGYAQATTECNQHIEQVTMRDYNQGYHEGTEVTSEIMTLWREKYAALDKLYKETVNQLQKTKTLSLPYQERRKLTRSTSA